MLLAIECCEYTLTSAMSLLPPSANHLTDWYKYGFDGLKAELKGSACVEMSFLTHSSRYSDTL